MSQHPKTAKLFLAKLSCVKFQTLIIAFIWNLLSHLLAPLKLINYLL